MATWRMRSEEEMDRAEKGRDPDIKKCRGPCQLERPRAEFDDDNGKADGKKGWCKECRKERALAKKENQFREVLENMDLSLLESLANARPGGTNLPHHFQVLESITALFGGVQGFAMYWNATFLAAPPGSQTRERMLTKMLGAYQAASDDGKVSKPRELMSKEELEASVQERLKRLRVAPDTIDGEAREAS